MSRLTVTIWLVLVASSVLLGLGLVAPCMTIQPSMGEPWDSWLRFLQPGELEPTTYSIISGILELMRSDGLWLGLILLAFSVVFPAMKLSTLWWSAAAMHKGQSGGVALWITHHAGKFSMLDVMVIAVLIVAIKGLPGESEVHIGWGLYAFAASVVLSIIASVLVGRLEKASANQGAGMPAEDAS